MVQWGTGDEGRLVQYLRQSEVYIMEAYRKFLQCRYQCYTIYRYYNYYDWRTFFMSKFYVRKDEQGNSYEVGALFKSDWVLVLQYGRYVLDDGEIQEGYRFMYRDPEGKLRPFRAGARIPSLRVARELMKRASDRGWGELDGGEDDIRLYR